MTLTKLLAIDLGASSGRVMQAIYDGQSLQLSEIHRFKNEPVNLNDGLYWNILDLFNEIKKGIKQATRQDDIPIQSISVDTWGVDYAYLDQSGDLLYLPHCYRDNRMGRYESEFYQKLDRSELFALTGVQPATINSVLQLYADLQEKPFLAEMAHRVLFMPDLVNYLLSGVVSHEYTIASTSGLMALNRKDWEVQVFDRLGIPRHWFSTITMGGQVLRQLSPRICQSLKIEPFKVIAGAGHDTASAVLAIPYDQDGTTAFISCGTWSLVGLEAQSAVTDEVALAAGLTNERCFDGHYRLLKNTTGLWILQELQRDWRLQGDDLSFAEMTHLAMAVEDNATWINPHATVFASPHDMEAKIKEYCRLTQQDVPQTKGQIVRVVLESLALAYRQTMEQLEALTHLQIDAIHMVGGGIQNRLLCQLTANVTGKPVKAGPVEASALGNIVAQLMTLGLLKARQEAQALIRASEPLMDYHPEPSPNKEVDYARFQALMEGGV